MSPSTPSKTVVLIHGACRARSEARDFKIITPARATVPVQAEAPASAGTRQLGAAL